MRPVLRRFALPRFGPLAALGLGAVFAVPALHAQTDAVPLPVPSAAGPDARPRYVFAGLSGVFESVGKGQDDWGEAVLSVGARRPGLTATALVQRVSRYGTSDVGGGADVYADVGRGAYANVRVVGAPGADISPRLDAGAGLYVPVARVYEAGASARVLAFADDRVALLTGSLGRYVGNGFVQARATLVPREGEPGVSGTLLYRHYGATADAFVEASATAGREVIPRPGATFDIRRTTAVGIRAVRPLSARVAVSGSLGYTSDPTVPRVSVGAGIQVRR